MKPVVRNEGSRRPHDPYIAMNPRNAAEHKRAEENIRRMATVVRDSNDAITIQDFEGRITAWNRGAELMYGYSEEEALLANIDLLTAPGKVEEQKDFTRRLVAGEKVTSFETRRVTKDGRVLDVWMTVTKLMDEGGKPIGLASTERDITERKRAEEEASRMATVVRDSNDAVLIQDFNGQITAWNHGAELMYSYSEEEALQMSIGRLTAPGKVEEQSDFTRRLLAGETISAFETQRMTKDGRVLDVWMTITKLMDEAGNPIGIASTERDITERKRAVEKLRETNDYLENLISHANAPIIVWDPQFRITRFNGAFESLTGRRVDEVVGKSLEILFPPALMERSMGLIAKTRTGERWETVEISIQHIDGTVRAVLWNSATIFAPDGKTPVATIAQGMDVTERLRAVEEVHRLNAELEQRVVERTAQLEAANKELEAFSYSVSHDLRAPLRHVQGYVNMLGREAGGQLSDQGRRYMKTIADASREMGVLIDDLLAFSRMGRADMIETRVNLDSLVQTALRDLEPATRERNIVWKTPPLPAVQADPAMLKLALTNLLSNAVKFTGPRDPAQIEIGCGGMEGERVIVFVRDNGVGFDPQYAHKLFGVFQRLHRADEFEGTGIGLANVQRMIARQGGRVWAEGALDRGATFYFTLKPSASTNPAN
jgi:PAS domain S-box-containing protein